MYLYIFHVISLRRPELEFVVLVEIQMFIFLCTFILFFYHDCIFINFYSNAAHKFPVYGTIKFYCIVLYCIVCACFVGTPVCVLHAGCLNDNW